MKKRDLLKGLKVIAALSISQLLLYSCVLYAPVNSSFERAKTLGGGKVELMGNYSSYSIESEGESEKINENYGLRMGIGITDGFDIKFRYEKITPTYIEDNDESINYYSVIPKFNIYNAYQNQFSGSFGIGCYSEDYGSFLVLSPKLYYTYQFILNEN